MKILLKNNKSRFLSHPLGDLRVAYGLLLELVGKPVVDFLFVVTELFRYVLLLKHYERNLSKSAFFKGGGSLWVQISDGRGRRPPTAVGVRKREWLPFCMALKYPWCIVWFCHKAYVWQTDGQTNEWTDRITTHKTALAAASRGKKQ